MALRVETEVELKSPPEKLYKLVQKEAHLWPAASPNNLQAVELHEGDWETHGSVKLWSYTFEGKTETFKERIELDDENLKVTLVGVDGDVFQYYKSYKVIFHYVPKGEGSLANLALEYEKLREDVPDDLIKKYLDLIVSCTKDKDAYLLKA
ncbi:Bet_v_1 domain-containing protein [Cephalotus follicularis]|uniref:Bet_v_1 domain-containing protein n=1 Tax=Cephalotus follicularis TaxID=3775 RepID=A0A1Q3BI97_CEPFO|nr:Bet_v_1 domain-containing protein [Cephalotus follicularis]